MSTDLLSTPTSPSDSVAATLPPRQSAEPASRAVERLYREHYTMIASYLYRRTASVHLSEDLAAQTFLIALRTYHRFNPAETSPLYRLLRIATNAANHWARDERRRLRREQSRGTLLTPEQSPGWTTEQSDLRAAVTLLPARNQEVIALYYFASLGVSEIAKTLACREGTVKSRLARGRTQLKTLLDEHQVSDRQSKHPSRAGGPS